MDSTDDFKNIWNKGFQINEPNLSTQKMNEMRNRESENLIEKINKTARADQRALPFVALVVVGLLALFGYYSFALFLAGVFTALYLYNETMLQKLAQVELKDSVLKYLVDFRTVANTMVRHYTWVVGLGTLLIGVPMLLFSIEVAGVPMEEFLSPASRQASLLLLAICTLLFSVLCALGYRLSVRMLYGQKLQKIDEMIAGLKTEV
ncbi:hypothetical protein [Pontibacter akesuensis]|uniref:Uncharacterized protein n=1 Tax=Pontibacter akesuensis TaxID=388950 RepID=A0A1I7IBN7_9BACT|nr:hypothetical protein [Pontibacter akesuensis]GHA66228.1 hypothetical protein GCM10007389_19080 [Pontibacter akesuensis]SFU70344.1 hypothetical protein SAMN04487941_2075 [Pontibacter akesuensis]